MLQEWSRELQRPLMADGGSVLRGGGTTLCGRKNLSVSELQRAREELTALIVVEEEA